MFFRGCSISILFGHLKYAISFSLILIVGNPGAGILAKEGRCETVEELRDAARQINPCTAHALRVGQGRVVLLIYKREKWKISHV